MRETRVQGKTHTATKNGAMRRLIGTGGNTRKAASPDSIKESTLFVQQYFVSLTSHLVLSHALLLEFSSGVVHDVRGALAYRRRIPATQPPQPANKKTKNTKKGVGGKKPKMKKMSKATPRTKNKVLGDKKKHR